MKLHLRNDCEPLKGQHEDCLGRLRGKVAHESDGECAVGIVDVADPTQNNMTALDIVVNI